MGLLVNSIDKHDYEEWEVLFCFGSFIRSFVYFRCFDVNKRTYSPLEIEEEANDIETHKWGDIIRKGFEVFIREEQKVLLYNYIRRFWT